MMEARQVVVVQESASQMVHATSARILVEISGHSFFTGREAFKKADEVASCVEALKACGIAEDGIQLLNVAARVSSGKFKKSSAAQYTLAVKCEPIDRLGAALAAIASQKNAEIRHVYWGYDDLEKTRLRLLDEAVRAAKSVGQSIAHTLDADLLGLQKLTYKTSRPSSNRISVNVEDIELEFDEDFACASGGLPDLNLAHVGEVGVTVDAEFLIGLFNSQTDAD